MYYKTMATRIEFKDRGLAFSVVRRLRRAFAVQHPDAPLPQYEFRGRVLEVEYVPVALSRILEEYPSNQYRRY